jgi:alpha-mannosidase
MLNTPQRAVRTAMNHTEQHSFLSLEGTGYSLSAFINEGDKQLTLRLFNSEGDSSAQSIILPSNVVKIQHVDLLGNVLDEVPVNSRDGVVTASVSMPRFAVNTYRLYTK